MKGPLEIDNHKVLQHLLNSTQPLLTYSSLHHSSNHLFLIIISVHIARYFCFSTGCFLLRFVFSALFRWSSIW